MISYKHLKGELAPKKYFKYLQGLPWNRLSLKVGLDDIIKAFDVALIYHLELLDLVLHAFFFLLIHYHQILPHVSTNSLVN